MIPDESSKTFPLLWIHKNNFLQKKKKKQKQTNKQTTRESRGRIVLWYSDKDSEKFRLMSACADCAG